MDDIEEIGPEIQKLREFEASIPPPRDINEPLPRQTHVHSSTTRVQERNEEDHVILLPACQVQHLEPNPEPHHHQQTTHAIGHIIQ